MATSSKFFASALTVGLLCFVSGSYADQDTQNLIGGYGESQNAITALTAQPNDSATTASQDNAQALYLPSPTNPFGTEKTQTELFTFFAPANQLKPDQQLANNQVTFGPPGTLPPGATNFYQPGSQANQDKLKQSTPFTNVDLNSLVGPLVYQQDEQKQSAKNFISAIGNLNNPFPVVDLVSLAANQNPPVDVTALTQANPTVTKYLNELRAYAAMQSIGLSNLYQLYAERVPSNVDAQQNPQLASALAAIGMPNASQLQLENYMATRRLTDPNWIASLSKDSPAALLRQIAILMAENLAESYNNRLATERLTATMSALVLQQGMQTRPLLEQDAAAVTKPQPTTPG